VVAAAGTEAEMAYIHESSLQRAVSRLNALGGPSRSSGGGKSDKGLGQDLGGLINSSVAKNAATNLAAKEKAAALNSENLAKRDAMMEGEERWQEANELYGDHFQNVMPDSIKARIEANDTAENTRLAGQFTPGGLELNDRNATLNAQDRLMAKAMIRPTGQSAPGQMGLGGSRRF